MRARLHIVILMASIVLNCRQLYSIENLKYVNNKIQSSNAMLAKQVYTLSPIVNQEPQTEVFIHDKTVGVWKIRQVSFLELKDGVKPPTIKAVVKSINEIYSQPRYPGIVLSRTSGKTAYVNIKDSEQLTKRMGSTGAREYLAVVTTSLTSLPEIDSVSFIFEEGDHAVPGTYTRKDFLNLWYSTPQNY